MWNVDVKKMCKNHLLGEHLEMHMFAGCLKKGKNLHGYINNNLVEIHNIKKRHAALVKEMIKRKYSHNSPLESFKVFKEGKVDSKKNLKELKKRCVNCRKRK